jgi:hypothetical protein
VSRLEQQLRDGDGEASGDEDVEHGGPV